MTIFVEFDGELYRLMCNCGRMAPMPAGPRLFKGGEFPLINFTHAEPDTAEQDAKKLQRYVDEVAKKRQNKKEIRGHID